MRSFMKRLADAWAVLMGNKAAWDINADPMVAYEYDYDPWAGMDEVAA